MNIQICVQRRQPLTCMYWAQRALPLRAMTRWNNPSANGDMANIVADAAPESSPNKVTDSGSPPKESMLSLIQRSAVSWSWRAQLPGNRLSPVLRKPLIKLNEPNHRLNSRNRRSWRNLYLWQPGTQFNLIKFRRDWQFIPVHHPGEWECSVGGFNFADIDVVAPEILNMVHRC